MSVGSKLFAGGVLLAGLSACAPEPTVVVPEPVYNKFGLEALVCPEGYLLTDDATCVLAAAPGVAPAPDAIAPAADVSAPSVDTSTGNQNQNENQNQNQNENQNANQAQGTTG
ncbi:hypothetical protein [Thalassovita taeanensis]|uniref:Uncharacterized protein n=1 Tax=Thalassovita taeanensis TaxID=657014 RepID=A0A1H9EHN6_9RHOB|nr:hypothetical protein [Thalassovita taeanensis]SEQ24753.1 hypothetical protein SAMN04488092_10541 [Thalassovita taeanensis]